MSISMRCSFFPHSLTLFSLKYSLIQPVTFLNLSNAINYWLVDGKKAEGKPAPAPLSDEEEMVKYWKNFKSKSKK